MISDAGYWMRGSWLSTIRKNGKKPGSWYSFVTMVYVKYVYEMGTSKKVISFTTLWRYDRILISGLI